MIIEKKQKLYLLVPRYVGNYKSDVCFHQETKIKVGHDVNSEVKEYKDIIWKHTENMMEIILSSVPNERPTWIVIFQA